MKSIRKAHTNSIHKEWLTFLFFFLQGVFGNNVINNQVIILENRKFNHGLLE